MNRPWMEISAASWRIFDVAEPARSPEGERRLWELAAANPPPGRAGNTTRQMDLGATICTPLVPTAQAARLQPGARRVPWASRNSARFWTQARDAALPCDRGGYPPWGPGTDRPAAIRRAAGWLGVPAGRSSQEIPGRVFAAGDLRGVRRRDRSWRMAGHLSPRLYPLSRPCMPFLAP